MIATWKLKTTSLFIFFGLYFFTYIIPNFFPIFVAKLLPLTAIDSKTPFIPESFLIYLSDYALGVSVVYFITDRRHFLEFATRMYSCLILCGICFWFFPTIYPRPEYPEVTSVVTRTFMYLVRNLDAPTNCLPSQHVALTWVCFSCLPFKSRGAWLFYFVWSVAICVTTLTTKQHYVVDIFGGLAVAFLCIPIQKLITGKFLRNMVMVSHASDPYRTGTVTRSDHR